MEQRTSNPDRSEQDGDLCHRPHSDASGEARRITTATVLAGEASGECFLYLTPAEEREYNEGMARLAEEWG